MKSETRKFIVGAKTGNEILSLLKDTKSAYMTAHWDSESIYKCEKPAYCSEEDVADAFKNGDFRKIDDLIMSGEVPVGGMVVVCDGKTPPVNGYVCGNGISWFEVKLPKDVASAVMDPAFYMD